MRFTSQVRLEGMAHNVHGTISTCVTFTTVMGVNTKGINDKHQQYLVPEQCMSYANSSALNVVVRGFKNTNL